MSHKIKTPRVFSSLQGLFGFAKERIVPTRSRVMWFGPSEIQTPKYVISCFMLPCDPALPNSLLMWWCLAYEFLYLFMLIISNMGSSHIAFDSSCVPNKYNTFLLYILPILPLHSLFLIFPLPLNIHFDSRFKTCNQNIHTHFINILTYPSCVQISILIYYITHTQWVYTS